MKYNELLERCQQASDQHSHKAVQTAYPVAIVGARRRLSSSAAFLQDEGQQPEYKVLFNEIFTRIQKTKVDLSESKWLANGSHSGGPSQGF